MADAVTVLGTFTDAAGSNLSDASLMLDGEDISQNWRRCSLTADFLAKYYSYYFPYREKAMDRISREAAENSISYILNELIENTAKYSDSRDQEVEVAISLREDDIIFQVSNHVSERRADSFLRLARELLEGNTQELYIKQLETESDSSGLGYLTMINDYGVSLGFRIERTGEDVFRVTVQAIMKWKEA
jgi:hypothetical protein